MKTWLMSVQKMIALLSLQGKEHGSNKSFGYISVKNNNISEIIQELTNFINNVNQAEKW